MTPLWFAIAAAVGALARHGVNQLGLSWKGTLVVNVVGSFVLGVLAAGTASADALTIVGTGGCGSFTTFSMFSLEAIEAHHATRVWVVASTVGGTIAAAALGYWIA